MITRDFSVISIDVTGVSLSLYYSQKSLTHNIGNASAFPIITKEVYFKGSYRAEIKLTLSQLFHERSNKTQSLKSASLSRVMSRFAAYAYFFECA